MAKRYQILFSLCLIVIMSLSTMRIDNTVDALSAFTRLSQEFQISALVENGSYEVNRGYSSIEKPDYLSENPSARLSSTFYKRSQNFCRNSERHKVSVATLDVIFKVVLFSIVMILIATGGVGLSMPFRCLLYYIHGMDGKKKIA